MSETAFVYVVDNGASYSDHTIAFVKTKWPREVVESAIIGWAPGATVTGVFDSIAWWKGKFSLLEQIVFVPRLNRMPIEDLRKLPMEFLESVVRLGLSHQDHLDELAERIESLKVMACQ